MLDKRNRYRDMYQCYLENEVCYWNWAMERKRFNSARRENKYLEYHITKKKRKKNAERLIEDFPKLAISVRDIKSQVGGGLDTIKEFQLGDFDDEPFWGQGSATAFYMYQRLKDYPDEIYEVVEEVYEWSIKLGRRTTEVAEAFPEVMRVICQQCLK